MKTNIEAIAIKNLQEILRERGYTAETLFSKFDLDGDGTLSKTEFEDALRSITGQVAPQAIVNAVFRALDGDSSGSLELVELLSIVDTGASPSFSEGQSIVVEGHPNGQFNGAYSQQEGTLNGKPHFKNEGGCMLYAFSSDSGTNGAASSWNLDDRQQNGSNDWYRGGWTRAPTDGSIPLGVRRWVGVGKLTLSPVDQIADGGTRPEENENAYEIQEDGQTSSGDSPRKGEELSVLMSEFDAAIQYFEGKVASGELSTDQVIQMANAAFERKSSDLSPVLRYSAQKVWDQKMSALENSLRSNSPSPSAIAAGAAAVGTIGAIASSTSQNIPAPYPPPPPAAPEPEPPAAPEPEPPAAPEPEPPAAQTSGHSELESVISGFQDARTISERNSIKESFSGSSSTVKFRVSSVERTFGIGLSDSLRGGNTLIAEVEGIGEVEIRLPSASDTNHLKTGYEGELSCSVSDWNAVRRRLILESN